MKITSLLLTVAVAARPVALAASEPMAAAEITEVQTKVAVEGETTEQEEDGVGGIRALKKKKEKDQGGNGHGGYGGGGYNYGNNGSYGGGYGNSGYNSGGHGGGHGGGYGSGGYGSGYNNGGHYSSGGYGSGYSSGYEHKGALPQTKCPSAITRSQPHAGRYEDKCYRGAACKSRFDPMDPVTQGYTGADILSAVGQKNAYLLSVGGYDQKAQAILEKVFGPLIEQTPTCGGTSQSPSISPPAPSASPSTSQSPTQTPAPMTALPGTECFLALCREKGADFFHYNYDLNFVPFQNELADLCTCILSNGVRCDATCNCHDGLSNHPFFPLGTPFCDCYCGCCEH